MAYGIVHHFPGGTKEQYEASIAAVHPTRDSLPKGQIFHAAGASAGGWTIVAVHDSKESWERFRDGILMPRCSRGSRAGSPRHPRRRTSRSITCSGKRLFESSGVVRPPASLWRVDPVVVLVPQPSNRATLNGPRSGCSARLRLESARAAGEHDFFAPSPRWRADRPRRVRLRSADNTETCCAVHRIQVCPLSPETSLEAIAAGAA